MSRISLKRLVLPAVIGLAAAFSAGAPASAAAIAPAVSVMSGVQGNVVQVDHRWGHRPGYRPGPACTANQAARKAMRMGFRNPRVVVRRNVVRVNGWRRGFRSSVVFARAPGCPTIR
ncbi:antifreeze protein [Phyllobacterium salinisoli]|uniref:Antifreeze protein n=1 Tax=Phyllobacterium salinisoli TaxID=1899321 RepID=A0A368K821_9HYPH|nr:antifreeze protein [Phyllobacterium salinisoli]RCS25507.1 antifreeze protein [Phyllobacterium salinisoli]